LLNSQVEVDGLVSFVNNTAANGGALLAHESEIMSHGGNMSFHENTVTVADHFNKTEEGLVHHNEEETGESGCGGSILLNHSNLQLDTAIFKSSKAEQGGSIFALSSTVTISGGVLIQQSVAEYGGGGLYLKSSHLHIAVDGTLEIVGSSAHVRGGAMCLNISNLHTYGTLIVRDSFPRVLTHFNKQTHGSVLDGAVYLESTVANFSGRTVFVNNSAHDGGGIYAMASTIRMSNHSILIRNRARVSGGVIYLEWSRLAVLDEVVMVSNSAQLQGGCVYSSVGSVIFLSGQGTYELNTAREGGVFALANGAYLTLSPPLRLNVTRNHATLNGGVLFYTDLISSMDCVANSHPHLRTDDHLLPSCFLKLNCSLPITNLNIKLNMSSNTARRAGSVIYGGNLDRCRMLVSKDIGIDSNNQCEAVEGNYVTNPLEIVRNIINSTEPFNSTRENTSAISSEPLRICFCENGIPDCGLRKTVRVIRGETFTISAMTVGQAMGIVPSTIKSNTPWITRRQHSQRTGSLCTNISYQIFTQQDSAILTLYPNGPCRDTGRARMEVQVNLMRCPDGFNRSLSQIQCVCEDRLLLLNAACNVDERSIEVRGGVWLKPVYENNSYTGIALHSNCPADYCVDTPLNVTLDNPDVLCDYNRTGYLCGACKTNYSLALGSFHCLQCSNNYLALLIPFALAGIVLVVFLLVLDITVAKGTINGLILYANIIQANKAIFLPAQQRNILTIFIAWLNLDLGIESCFYDGLTAYTHTWLQFAFPFYLWLLISLIIVFSHKSRHVTKWLSTNPVAVLATLLLMSYAKVLQTIICALSRTYLDTPTGLRVVWVFDGNINYFQSSKHIVLGIVAIAALLILFLPYSFLLLFGWQLQHHSDRKLFAWINKLKPFMDSVYGPYRNKMRYWPGLMLVIRCTLYLTFALNGLSPRTGNTTSSNLLAITLVFSGLAVLAWLSGRIYNKLYVDLLEAAHILNVSIFAAATYHVKVIQGNQATLAYTSISISFIIFAVVVLFHAYLRIKDLVFWKRLHIELTIAEKYNRLKNTLSGQKEIEIEGEEVDAMDFGVSEVTTSFVVLREPLLEN
jgi:predicted outer membrane repeat protein